MNTYIASADAIDCIDDSALQITGQHSAVVVPHDANSRRATPPTRQTSTSARDTSTPSAQFCSRTNESPK